MFPDRESSILLRDDSSGNICFVSLSVGIASLNRRLQMDYPLTGKEFSDFSFQRVAIKKSWRKDAIIVKN